MNPGTDHQEIAKAVAEAEYFSVKLFRGAGRYDSGNCDSLSAARDMGSRMEAAARNGRKAMVYAVASSRSVFVPPSFE